MEKEPIHAKDIEDSELMRSLRKGIDVTDVVRKSMKSNQYKDIEKHIQLVDDETTGAKEGYVINKGIAEAAADYEEIGREQGESPESSNRQVEGYIGTKIGYQEGGDKLKETYETGQLKDYNADSAVREADEVRDRATQNYKEFIAESDSEKLDKLRKQIRDEQKS